MKTKFAVITLLTCFLTAKLFAQIPNADFEIWHFVGPIENPESWTTNNGDFSTTEIAKDTDAYHGLYAMRLENYSYNKPVAEAKFPITSHPFYLIGFVKSALTDSDTVSVKISLRKNGLVVDSGTWQSTASISNYIQIKIPISNNSSSIDTAVIHIAGGNHTDKHSSGSKFYVDSLSLDFSSSINKVDEDEYAVVYPNPTSKALTVKFSDRFAEPLELNVLNLLGVSMVQKKISNSETLDLSLIPKGCYIVRIISVDEQIILNKIITVY